MAAIEMAVGLSWSIAKIAPNSRILVFFKEKDLVRRKMVQVRRKYVKLHQKSVKP